jgi:hypothetical protein
MGNHFRHLLKALLEKFEFARLVAIAHGLWQGAAVSGGGGERHSAQLRFRQ